VLGGVLLKRFWWGSVFLLAAPAMALLLLLLGRGCCRSTATPTLAGWTCSARPCLPDHQQTSPFPSANSP
jgi:hypothetical protein